MDTLEPPRRGPLPKAWLDAERRFIVRLAQPPRATVVLLGLLIAIHVLGGVLVPSDSGTWQRIFGLRPAEIMVALGARDGALVAEGEVWRLVSSGFLHWDVAHLFMNGLALWGLGRLCEVVFGPVRFFWLFLLCVIGGNVLSQTAHVEIVSAGASGGVFGLLGALVAFGLSRRASLSPPLREVFTKQLFPWILLNLGIGILLPFIDNRAHIGGLVTGAVVALVLGDSLTDDHRPWPWATVAMALAFGLAVGWAGSMVAFHAGFGAAP
ncbi:MAG: rhomboid family intramembrane serine protease [Pseudomonadota bacterium]|nr:rhomboid family intramembrane serine protease [Pseudomonadota bacterium]